MVTSVLDVYNAALSACHAKGRLTSLTENTRERFECDVWYSSVVKTVQEASFWPSSQSIEYLTLGVERDFTADWVETDPAPEYKYKYNLPTDFLRARYITTYARFDLFYDEAEDAVMLHTNQESAALVYSRLNENPAQWTPSQQQATIYGLAAHIAGPVSGRGELVQKNVQLANQILMQAQATVINGMNRKVQSLPPGIAARGFDDVAYSQYRYFYPFGGVFALGDTSA
jgi:hypothetical protein